MHVYTKNQNTSKYEVGYYDSINTWHCLRPYNTETQAATKVHYLNGGIPESKWKALMLILHEWRENSP